MKTTVFRFGKFNFWLAAGDILKQERCQYPGFGLFGRYYTPPPPPQYWNILTFNINNHKAKQITHYL